MLKNKITGAFHKSWSALFSFMLPVILVLISLMIIEVAPFGDNSFVFGDANGYHINYISYYKSILSGEHSIFYAFAKGMGSNVYGAANYDITSPYMLLFMLFPRMDYCTCYSLAIVLMAGLTGLAMERLLTEVYGIKLSNVLFSTAYAMSGFCVIFNYNLLLMSGPLMMPVALLGLYRLLKGKGTILFPLAVAYSVSTHFQMGFGVCVGVLVCFAGILYVKWKDWEGIKKKVVLRFVLSALAGGLIAAVVWVPTLISLQGGRAGLSEDDFVFSANNVFLQMGSRLYTGASSTDQIIDGFPAIYVGILVVALVVLFFVTKAVDIRHKQGAAGVLIFYLLSFYLKPLKNVLQGFTHANWFHFRYSFVFSCILVLIAAETYHNIKKVTPKEITKTAGIMVLGTIWIFSVEYDFIDGAYAVFDLAFLFIMGGVVYLAAKDKIHLYEYRISSLLLAITSIQLVANYAICNQNILDNWNMRVQDYKNAVGTIEPLIDSIKEYDDGFYRIENEEPRSDHSGNDGMFFDYFGVGYSGNSERDFVADGVADFGLSRRAREVTFYDKGMPAAMDALMGIKYLISANNLNDEKLYVDTGLGTDTRKIYENPYALSIATLSEDEIADIVMGEEHNIFTIHNNIWKALTGEDRDIFIQEESVTLNAQKTGDSTTLTYNFVADREGAIYVYDATGVTEDYGSDEDVLQYVGYYNQGDTVTGSIYLGDKEVETTYGGIANREVYVYYADEDVLWDYSNELVSRDVSIKYESDTYLKGTLKAEEGQRLFFTIPYDEGWTLYIDGKKSKINKSVDFLMASNTLTAGEHEYELKYTLPGFYKGLIMMIAGFALVVVMVVMDRKKLYNIHNAMKTYNKDKDEFSFFHENETEMYGAHEETFELSESEIEGLSDEEVIAEVEVEAEDDLEDLEGTDESEDDLEDDDSDDVVGD